MAASKDWRNDLVSVESIDMSLQADTRAEEAAKSPASGLHTKAVYLPSEPRTSNVGYGVVHLYRDVEDSGGKRAAASHSDRQDAGPPFDQQECSTLCILAVPSWMMPSDLLGFVGEQARNDVSHFRLIRTERANKYMALMKFRSAKRAQEWHKQNNGRLFSSAEPENCHVVFIKSVEFLTAGSKDVTFPNNNHDPFTTAAKSSKALSSKPFAPPPPNLLELPTCPVCLERMDETTGLLTILCQHVFHCACLEKWRGSGCPVCRYTHSPSYTFPYPRPNSSSADDDAEPMCSVCATTNNVWVCLICGNLGCGRYDAAHAYAHYEATSHCYAMDISTQHVWDYAGDGYVHRLIQSKPDSRLIDMPSGHARHENEAFRAEAGDHVPREKMENMAAEYTYLLTSQLEGQRKYFEEQVERAVDKAAKASAKAEEIASSSVIASQQLEAHAGETKQMRDSVSRLEKLLEKSEKARDKFEKMAREMSASLREEKTMNEGLLKRIKAAEATAEQAKQLADKAVAEKKDLEDMNNDLTIFISSQEKVKELQEQGEEVIDGSSGLVPGASKRKNKRK